jgi:probable selenium-dependent hydroxylase accessory protein YqeC
VVAVAGAGGKTTLVYRLADEARERGLRVLVTTTTHMGTLPEATTGPLFVEAEGEVTAALQEALRGAGRATLLGRRLRPDKLEGVSGERVDALAAHADLVLVEADGARGRSLKVPAAHEPVVPSSTTLLLVVAALDVLGRPLTEEHVHRLELVAQATGLPAGAAVDAAAVAAALRHRPGYPDRPTAARRGVFLNKVEDPAAAEAAHRIAAAVVPPYDFVVAGSARDGRAERL